MTPLLTSLFCSYPYLITNKAQPCCSELITNKFKKLHGVTHIFGKNMGLSLVLRPCRGPSLRRRGLRPGLVFWSKSKPQ